MFTKTVALSAVLLAAATLQAEAHATIQPMLGLTRTPVRSDAIRPSDSTPCGNVNIAQTFDTSTTIAVKADRTFTATITNFNAGVDGSREIVKASFDPTGTGNAFQDLKIITNGQHAPTAATGSEQLLFQLRHGLDCKGGKNGKKCLVAFKTAGGFGNCVVVEQGTGTAAKREGDEEYEEEDWEEEEEPIVKTEVARRVHARDFAGSLDMLD